MNEADDLYKHLSNEELISIIKEGDYGPFEALFQRHAGMVQIIINDFYIKSYEKEDFNQEARIVLNTTIHAYDKDRFCTFGNFFKSNLRHYYINLLRKDMAKKRRIEKVSESLDSLLENGFSPTYIKNFSGEMNFQQALEVKENIPYFYDSLSKFEYKVFLRYMKNMDKEEIAQELQCEVARVVNALDRCKRKLIMNIK
ncbi:sigma-70 family RNA polymerase sigma factor [Desemzia sp. FAM 24101]|uniref:sigma-70 family RNA polymerase sigma factor n=1 Tax=unclassified Desemzia TaxID=2685243 RepID=UPI003885B4DB